MASPFDLIAGTIANAEAAEPAKYPWSGVNSPFFNAISIPDANWDKLFPYRLIVYDVTAGAIASSPSGSGPGLSLGSTPPLGGGSIIAGATSLLNSLTGTGAAPASSSIISFTPVQSQWIFTLPITPQQLSIADQYSISTTATLNGVMEEHSGLRFKMITASGSMGVWPYRQSVVAPPQSPSLLGTLFGGTLNAVKSTISSVQGLVNTFNTGNPNSPPPPRRPGSNNEGFGSTGFYMAQALQQFLEQYAEAKRNPANAGWRLVFDIPKQKQSLVVTPLQFTWQQSANKALEVMYTLQFKAWRRIDLTNLKLSSSAVSPSSFQLTSNFLQRALAVITQARKVMATLNSLIGAVTSDVEAPLNALKQMRLFVNDSLGVVQTIADFPTQIQKDYSAAWADFLGKTPPSSLPSSVTSDPASIKAFNAIRNNAIPNEGLPTSSVTPTAAGGSNPGNGGGNPVSKYSFYPKNNVGANFSGQLGTSAAIAQALSPVTQIANNVDNYFNLISQVPVTSLVLNTAQQAQLTNQIQAVRQLTIKDFKNFQTTLANTASLLANSFGAGSSYVSFVYGTPAPTPRTQPMTLDEFSILTSLYDVIQVLGQMTSTTQIDDQQTQTSLQYVAGLAATSNIEFQISNSKFLAPVPHGLTMEGIAMRYLGDAQRWLEIATLNNLREPYIDESGFQLPLLSNASGRQVTVSSEYDLYLGDIVSLYSTTQVFTARAILGIDKLSDTNFLLTLDGPANLDNFLTADGAYLQAYLPGTVNSQQTIFIPSNLPPSPVPSILTPAVTLSDPLTGLSQVDFVLSDSGDIAIDQYGNFRLSYGLNNLIQAIKIKLGTSKGKWLLHPSFGLGIAPGNSIADLDVTVIYQEINGLIIQDPRFQQVVSLQVSLQGPVLFISMAISIVNSIGLLPINFIVSAL